VQNFFLAVALVFINQKIICFHLNGNQCKANNSHE